MSIVDTNNIIWNPYSGYSNLPVAPETTDIDVRDFTSGLAVPVGGVLGWDDDYLQSSLKSYGKLAFNYISPFYDVAFETSEMYAQRLSTVISGLVFTDSGASTTVYLFVKDVNGVYTMIGTAAVTATSIMDEGGYYIGIVPEFATYGATKIKFYIAAPSSGDVSFRMAVV